MEPNRHERRVAAALSRKRAGSRKTAALFAEAAVKTGRTAEEIDELAARFDMLDRRAVNKAKRAISR